MAWDSTRRQFLACSIGGSLVGLGGCLSGFSGGDTVSVEINVINNTQDKLRPLVHMNGHPDAVGPQTEGGYALFPKAVKVISLNAPRATYRLEVQIDDPHLIKQETTWEVTDKGCTHQSWAIVTGDEQTRVVDLLVDDCSQT